MQGELRAEGVYVTEDAYYPNGGEYSAPLYTIERVCGNFTTTRITITRGEARDLIATLSRAIAPK